jgi:DinB superfamily
MLQVGLENNFEGHSLAWVLGHPGCFANGADGPSALAAVPQAISDYRYWINSHTPESWLGQAGDEFQLVETWECWTIDDDFELAQEGYEVNAWFRHDWKPLSSEDILRGLLILQWGREDLLKTVSNLPSEILDRTHPNERWSISGILKHIAGGELWYLDRFGQAFPSQELPEQPLEQLELVRKRLIEFLPELAGSTQVVGLEGEFWSPRKLLRRAVWHEYDHIAHIRKLL